MLIVVVVNLHAQVSLMFCGKIVDGQKEAQLSQVSIVKISPDNKYIYVLAQGNNAVSWFCHDNVTNELVYLNGLIDGKNGVDGLGYPSSMIISSKGKYVYISSLTEHSISWFDRNETNGSLTYKESIKDGESGADGLKGASCITISPDEKFIYVTGPQDSAICWFECNSTNGSLTYKGFITGKQDTSSALAWPVSAIVSNDGKHIYVLALKGMAISWFDRNETTGAITYKGHLKEGIDSIQGLSQAYFLKMSPDGKQVYVTSQESMSGKFSWFNRDLNSGALTYKGTITDGENGINSIAGARSIEITYSCKYIYVVAEFSNSISWFERDLLTDSLTYKGCVINGVNGLTGLVGAYDIDLNKTEDRLYLGARGDKTVCYFDRDTITGHLIFKDSFKDGEDAADKLDGACGALISPDEKHIYVTSVWDNAVTFFKRDSTNGDLRFTGCIVEGQDTSAILESPSAISISPDGNIVYVTSSMVYDVLNWLTRNPSTGLLYPNPDKPEPKRVYSTAKQAIDFEEIILSGRG